MKFIHLTDTHFIPPGKLLYGRDPRVALDAAVADINAHHADADRVVITGDLTHWGEPQAFRNLADALAPLSMPVHLLVGNHDRREVFRDTFPQAPVDAGGFIQGTEETPAGLFVFLDTMQDGTHAGYYCAERRAWLAETLAAAKGDVFLFMHHPPFITGIPASDRIGLKDADPFRAVVAPYRAKIRHLFYGHVHRPICGSWLGIPTSTLRAMNHQVWLDLENEELQGSFEPPAYGVVLIDADTVVVHSHDFMDASPKFELHSAPWDDWCRRERAGTAA